MQLALKQQWNSILSRIKYNNELHHATIWNVQIRGINDDIFMQESWLRSKTTFLMSKLVKITELVSLTRINWCFLNRFITRIRGKPRVYGYLGRNHWFWNHSEFCYIKWKLPKKNSLQSLIKCRRELQRTSNLDFLFSGLNCRIGIDFLSRLT